MSSAFVDRYINNGRVKLDDEDNGDFNPFDDPKFNAANGQNSRRKSTPPAATVSRPPSHTGTFAAMPRTSSSSNVYPPVMMGQTIARMSGQSPMPPTPSPVPVPMSNAVSSPGVLGHSTPTNGGGGGTAGGVDVVEFEDVVEPTHPVQEYPADSVYAVLMRPLPLHQGGMKMYIVREKMRYSCHRYEDDRLLMTAYKEATVSTYGTRIIISQSYTSEGRDPIAVLSSNMWGNRFALHDEGLVNNHPAKRGEYATIYFRVSARKKPRKVKVALPLVKETDDGEFPVARWVTNISKGFLNVSAVKKIKLRPEGMELLMSRPGRWRDNREIWTSKFPSDPKIPSVKNFTLSRPREVNSPLMVLGKVGRNRFNVEFSHPLSPMQAFSIAVADIDRKLLNWFI